MEKIRNVFISPRDNTKFFFTEKQETSDVVFNAKNIGKYGIPASSYIRGYQVKDGDKYKLFNEAEFAELSNKKDEVKKEVKNGSV